MKKNLLLSLITIFMSLLLLGSVTFAWIAVVHGRSADTFIAETGDIDLTANIYIGSDEDKDGTLDYRLDNGGNPIPVTRAQNLEYYYTACSKNLINQYTSCAPGTSVTLKIIVENSNDKNDTGADVSIYLSEMESYFYQCINAYMATVDFADVASGGTLANATELNSVLGANSTRLMFLINNLTARIYSPAEGSADNSLTTGYDTLLKSSVGSECIGSVTAIGALNSAASLSPTALSYHLWSFGSEENIIDNIVLDKGQLMEIDMQLSCILSEELDVYINLAEVDYAAKAEYLVSQYCTANSITATTADIKSLAADYISQMAGQELSYIVTHEEGVEKSLDFSVDKIFVIGTQRAS